MGQALRRRKRWNRALAEERLAELESELEQDEHPIDYEAELEDEEEEAAPVSDKRLKREMRAEAIRRLEEAARTEKDFRAVVEEWNKLDRNRDRRERDHTKTSVGMCRWNIRRCPEPKLIPRWMNNPTYRQLMAGNFLDILFDCPYEMHNLTARHLYFPHGGRTERGTQGGFVFPLFAVVQHHQACRCAWAV